MKTFLRSFLASMLAYFLMLILFLLVLTLVSPSKTSIKNNAYLIVDIYGSIPEYNPPSGAIESLFGGDYETLQRILDNLKKAAVDDRIKGVVFKISASSHLGYAKMQELREAIHTVQDSGKHVYAFSDYLDRKTYYLASACDSIYMPETSTLLFTGFAATSQHIRGTLDKLGIKPNIHRIKEYKGAAEMITRKNMSETVRANRLWMLEEYWDHFADALETERGLNEDAITRLMHQGIFTASKAVTAKLIDNTLYWDELQDQLKEKEDDALRMVCQSRYADENPKKFGFKGKKKIAVIHAQGTIGGRRNRVDPLFGIMMGHESVCAQLKKARENKKVAAVVFRIDSPGGESMTSHLIAHEVEKTASAKPVVVSMVDVAASGGYTIAYKANKLVADPLTITGSIGSISGKFNMKGLYDKIGLSYDHVTKGPMALIFSDDRDFTAAERERFVQNHWTHFNEWLKDVAEHRGLSFAEAEKLAHGRVWSGRQAVANCLVDTLGGLNMAIEQAKKLAGIPDEESVTITHLPKKRGLLSALFSNEGAQSVLQDLVYRWIQTDLAETRHMMNRSWEIMTPVEIE